jgi:hypothetical protein
MGEVRRRGIDKPRAVRLYEETPLPVRRAAAFAAALEVALALSACSPMATQPPAPMGRAVGTISTSADIPG